MLVIETVVHEIRQAMGDRVTIRVNPKTSRLNIRSKGTVVYWEDLDLRPQTLKHGDEIVVKFQGKTLKPGRTYSANPIVVTENNAVDIKFENIK